MFLGKGIRLGSIAGIPIKVDYSWFIVFALLVVLLGTTFGKLVPGMSAPWYWGTAVVTTLLFFGSVLGHELSHALVARRCNIPIQSITLFMLGAVAQMEDEPPTAWDEFRMAIAGPISSALFGLFFLAVAAAVHNNVPRLISWALLELGVLNIVLAIFNMLPGFPMDGGRVFRAILWGATGNLLQSTRIASITGQAFGIAFIAIGVISLVYPPYRMYLGNAIWLGIVGLFLFTAARSQYQQILLRETLRQVPVENVMNAKVETVPATISVERLVQEFFLRDTPSTLPVERDGELVGTVSVEDVRGVPKANWPTTLVNEIAKPLSEAEVLHPNNDAWDAANRLSQGNDDGVLVTEDRHVEGIITRGSIMRWLQTHSRLAPGQA